MAVKLVDVDVTVPLQTIHDIDRYSSVRVLVRNGNEPIGHIQIDGCRHEITPGRLADAITSELGFEILRHRLYQDLLPGDRSFTPYISVLICTRDRSESLKATLDSLAAQDYSRFEVLVIDNHPSDGKTAELTAKYPFRYVLEDRPGLDWARNRGIEEAKGEIVAFIDDDATASPHWLSAVAEGFSDEDVDCVTGLVVAAELDTQAQELFELAYGGFFAGFEPTICNRKTISKRESYWPSVGAGCNMSFRKSVFDDIGLFDVALDVGTVTGGGGDLDIFHRLIQAGRTISYRPDALVRHKHRDTDDAFRKMINNYGRAFFAYLTKCLINEPDARLKILRIMAYWYWYWFIRRAIRRLLKREAMPFKLILTEALGSFRGPQAYFRAVKNAREIASAFRAAGGA